MFDVQSHIFQRIQIKDEKIIIIISLISLKNVHFTLNINFYLTFKLFCILRLCYMFEVRFQTHHKITIVVVSYFLFKKKEKITRL